MQDSSARGAKSRSGAEGATQALVCWGASLACTIVAGCSATSVDQPTRQPVQTSSLAHPVPQAPMLHSATSNPSMPPKTAMAFAPSGSVPKVRGVYKVGSPYVVAGVTYVPSEDLNYDKVGLGSWYGLDFHGKQTANGEFYDMNALTAAHPTLPLPSYAWVTNLRNGRTVLVRVNDRGPYKPGRIIDMSRGAARALGYEGQGVTEVRVRYAGRAPLESDDDRRERMHLASQPWARGIAPPYSLGMRPAAERQIASQQ